MKIYEYKIITFYHGSLAPDWELTQAGQEGFRVVGQAPLYNTTYNDANQTVIEHIATQIIMEKEIGDQNAE